MFLVIFLYLLYAGVILNFFENPPIILFLVPMIIWGIFKIKDANDRRKQNEQFSNDVVQKRRDFAQLIIQKEELSLTSLGNGVHFVFHLNPCAARDGIELWYLAYVITPKEQQEAYNVYGYNLEDLKESGAKQICQELSKLIGGGVVSDTERNGQKDISLLTEADNERRIQARRAAELEYERRHLV